ncbi:cobalt-precorrin-5b c(1)-methyltransferase cbid [Lucifera butyrica]|uniref:Cobalt-precorrin-5B C(1)-methyltransferase n=1 Tax=Lucifera butyrica TaxID=1351585 RepID=A0A498R9M7_9FIRM|nr:cobalt-precorrin-5B (C(1))-methyltransferase CbiD [Lucifera butyrica]VBB06843.1 cobalt-precorrin-5b c(1)-methyltransferase cbid [Lucifera butyrica]
MSAEKLLRSGITTGACAAGAAKAAILAGTGQAAAEVRIVSPQGRTIVVPVAWSRANPNGGTAMVIKDAGDDPDITNGAKIIVTVEFTGNEGILLKAGEGVGTVTKPGLSVPVGQPAINPGPRIMIEQAVREVLPPQSGAVVTVIVEGGRELATRTLNPVLGIEGGISIIGTTGIVEPMSEEAFKASLVPQISVVKALGFQDIVFVPGRIGQNAAVNRYHLPADAVVQTSNFIGHMLENAVKLGVSRVLLFGHLGKVVKVAAGIFHTHNRMADGRMETIAAYMAAGGAPQTGVQEILACATTEAAMDVIQRYGMAKVYTVLAERASLRAMRYVFNDLTVGTVIVTLQGDILGMDHSAELIGGSLGWNIKLS